MKNRILLSLFFVILFLKGVCCDCLESGSVKEAVKRSSVVILAKAISHDTILKDTTTNFEAGYGYWRFKFLVKEKFAGTFSSDTVTIMTPIGETACGIQFVTGQDYIVYGSAWTMDKKTRKPIQLRENLFWTNSCSRTKALDNYERNEIREVVGLQKE